FRPCRRPVTNDILHQAPSSNLQNSPHKLPSAAKATLAPRKWLREHKISYDGQVNREGYVCDETTY
ncbi:MAG: hypothetical protein WA621_14170, partial [Candidatus Acidiferrum sp.]